MIRLNLPKESYWLDLPDGVRVKVRPLTTSVYEAARYDAQNRVRKILEEMGEVAAVGGSVEGIPDLTDEAQLQGFTHFLFVQSLARTAIERWEGVLEADGTPAPVKPGCIDELMSIHSMAENFILQYTAPYEALLREGEFSASGASGTSEAAPTIAAPAGMQTPPVPEVSPAATAADAPTTNIGSAP